MIDRLYRNIEAGLEQVKPCTIYKEDLPPEHARPSFLISLKEQTLQKGINSRETYRVTVDISYYPADTQFPKLESQRLGAELAGGLRIADLKMKKRNWKFEENTLHLLFDAEVRSYLSDDEPHMQTMSQNTNLKEE